MEEIKELIEFCEKHAITPRNLIKVYTLFLENAFNEINSNESNEFRTVGNNENTQEKCHKPKLLVCDYLKNKGCIKEDCSFYH